MRSKRAMFTAQDLDERAIPEVQTLARMLNQRRGLPFQRQPRPRAGTLRVRVHPDDFALMQEFVEALKSIT